MKTLFLFSFTMLSLVCATGATLATPSTDHAVNALISSVAFSPPVNNAGHDDHAQHQKPKHDHDHVHGKAGDVTATTQQLVDKLAGAYLELTNLLAADMTDGAKKLLSRIHIAGHDLSDVKDKKLAALGDRIGKGAHEKVSTLKAIRETYKAISPDVVALVNLAPPTKKVAPVIYQAFCPHAKASWLQLSKMIRNPYFGSAMLKCGQVTKTIAAVDAKSK